MAKNEENKEIDNSWSVPEKWKGETVYVIGGGPSLNDMDLSVIKDKNVLGINNAYKLGDWVDVVYWMDMPWWNLHKEDLLDFPNIKVTTLKRVKDIDHPNLKYVEGVYQDEPSDDSTKLPVKAHSGFAAIHLAYMLGAETIVLLGYDMKVRDGNHNWHTDHERKVQEKIYRTRFIPSLKDLAGPLKERGVNILNATPDTALDIWPKVNLEEYVRST